MKGFSLPVVTSAELCPVAVVGMGGQPKLREGKVTPDGRLTYASGCMLMVERNGELTAQKSASVHVVEPAATYEVGTRYVAQGSVWVMPYESNSRVALSVTVERLVPEAQAQPSNRRENAAG